MTQARKSVLEARAHWRKSLAAIPPLAGAKAVAEQLHAGVERFVAGAAASDDLTILTVRWNRP